MNDLQIFKNSDFGELRTIVKDGEPWFAAKDICEMFKDSNRNRTMQSLDDDEKGYTQMNTPRGNQSMAVVNEAGLYSMLFAMQPKKARGVSEEYIKMRSDQLKRFKRWVTHEVIPSIRKHGAYATPATIESLIQNPESGIKLLTALKEEQDKRKVLEDKVNQDRPKVLFADAVAASESPMLIGELAKVIKQNGVNIGEKRLFEWLRNNGYLIRRKGTDYNSPTQRSMEMGLFKVKETAITHSDGHITVNRTTKVTGRGQRYFVNKFLGSENYDN